jgi:hypothetical protein
MGRVGGVGATGAYAQDLEPRLYSNTPVGMNFLIAGYSYSQGGVLTDPSAPLTNGEVTVHSPFSGVRQSLDLWGLSGKVDAALPYACASGSASLRGCLASATCAASPIRGYGSRSSFYGAPALTLEEFATYKQDILAGASVQVAAPLGQYDADKLLNLGTNRWFIKPEIGVSKALGPVTLELAAGVTFYTPNHDIFGGHEKQQAPIYACRDTWCMPFRMASGRRWTAPITAGTDDHRRVRGDDLQENSRFGVDRRAACESASLGEALWWHRRGDTYGGNFNTVGIAWQFRWGGGL